MNALSPLGWLYGVGSDLRNALYRHLQQMSLPFYTTTRAGEIVSRINNDVTAVHARVEQTLRSRFGADVRGR